MPYTRRGFLGLALATLAGSKLAHAASGYPQRPIRWVVGYPAGGGTDVLARNIGAQISQQLGQQVVVDNRPGASGIIAADVVAKSPADGYTVFTADNGILVYNPALYKKLPYLPSRDFVPIGLMASIHLALVTAPGSGLANGKQVLEAMKKNPGALNYATPGNGSPHHLAMELFKSETGLRATHVPYKGAGQALTDVMGGQIPLMLLDLASGYNLVKTGKVVPLICFSKTRPSQLASVPTMAELGYPKVEAYAWSGLVAPAGTSKEIQVQLSSELKAAMKSPGVLQRMYDAGQDPISGDPSQMLEYIASETQKWHALIKARNISLD